MAAGTKLSTAFAAGVIGAGVSNASPVDFDGRSTFTRARIRNVAAAARPSPSANQCGRNRRCFGNTPAVAVPRPAASDCARLTSIRALKSGETGRGRSFFNSASSSEKSFMDDKVLFQRGKRVTITRRRRVLGNRKGRRDLGEGELVPDFHYQHLPLLDWQKINGGSQSALRAIIEIKLCISELLHVGLTIGL